MEMGARTMMDGRWRARASIRPAAAVEVVAAAVTTLSRALQVTKAKIVAVVVRLAVPRQTTMLVATRAAVLPAEVVGVGMVVGRDKIGKCIAPVVEEVATDRTTTAVARVAEPMHQQKVLRTTRLRRIHPSR